MWGKERGKVRLHTGTTRMLRNFKYFIVFTSAHGVLQEQNDWYRIQPWKVNEIKAYKNQQISAWWKICTKPHFFFTLYILSCSSAHYYHY